MRKLQKVQEGNSSIGFVVTCCSENFHASAAGTFPANIVDCIHVDRFETLHLSVVTRRRDREAEEIDHTFWLARFAELPLVGDSAACDEIIEAAHNRDWGLHRYT